MHGIFLKNKKLPLPKCLTYRRDFDLNKNPKTALETSQNIIGV